MVSAEPTILNHRRLSSCQPARIPAKANYAPLSLYRIMAGDPSDTMDLRTPRLLLREVQLDDAEALLLVRSDPEAAGRFGAEPFRDREQAESWIRDYMQSREKGSALMWAMVERSSGTVIGECCLWNIDPQMHRAELGVELRPDRWHQGLAREALVEMIAFGFQTLGLHRIEADHLEGNLSSQRLLAGLGFRLEGTLRGRHKVDERAVDELRYGLLRSEWAAPQAANGR